MAFVSVMPAVPRVGQMYQPQGGTDGYNLMYEKDGQYYTRAANPEYENYAPAIKKGSGIMGFLRGAIIPKIVNKALGKDAPNPYIYTPVNPVTGEPEQEALPSGLGAKTETPMPQAGLFSPSKQKSVPREPATYGYDMYNQAPMQAPSYTNYL
jgi:hypothetical protein